MQTKFLHKIKWYKPFLVFCVLVIQTPFFNQVFAQEFQVTVNLQRPSFNELKMEDAWKLTITYITQDTAQFIIPVYFYAELTEGDAGLIVTGSTDEFLLSPGVTRLTAANLLELNPQIDYRTPDPRYEESIRRTGGLPDGDYELCVYVRLVGENNDIAYDCFQQSIDLMEAPQLFLPDDGETLANKRPEFAWIHAVKPGVEASYTITIVEVHPSQSAEIALQNNLALFKEDNLRTTRFQYPTYAMKLEQGKKYAWGVEINGVWSEIFTFNIAKEEKPEEKVIIKLTSPTEEQPAQNNRPEFKWKPEPAVEGMKYTLTVREIDEEFDPESGKIFFERSGIDETNFQYQDEIPPLDTTKVYAWQVTGFKNAKVIAVSQLRPIAWHWPWKRCKLIPLPSLSSPQEICLGSTPKLMMCAWARMSGPGIKGRFYWELKDPNGKTLKTGWKKRGMGALVCVSILMPTTPGVYTYTLSVTRGRCPKSVTFTFYLYPKLSAQVLDYPNGNPITDLCWGTSATLKMVDGNGDLWQSGCKLTWEYKVVGARGWNTLGQGNTFNTNPITNINPLFSGLSCTKSNIVLQFRGTVNLNCLNLPQPWPPGCSNVITTSLKVWCPTDPGKISVSSSTHTCNSTCTQICSINSISPNPNYPVNLTLTLSSYVGTVDEWTIDKVTIPGSQGKATINYNNIIMSAGDYKFCAKVKNGPFTSGLCGPKSTCVTVTIEDPITGTINITQNDMPTSSPEVCWGDDKVTMTFVPNNPLPAGTILTWQYQINCKGGWTNSGVTGTTQNANDVILSPFYVPQPNPCNADKVCWQVIAESASGICLPSIIGPVTIKVVQPFDKNNPPVILPSQPAVKCPNDQVILEVTNITCATGPFSYQWYFDGLPITLGGNGPSYPAVDPGNYTVVVFNKLKCDFIETKPVTVRDCSTKVVIKGPCTCQKGQMVTLTAPTSHLRSFHPVVRPPTVEDPINICGPTEQLRHLSRFPVLPSRPPTGCR